MFVSKIKSLENIKNYQVSDNNLMYCNRELNIYINDILVSENNESYFCDKKLMGFHIDNETFFINSKGEIINKFNVIFYPKNLIDNSFITSKQFFKNSKGIWESDLYLYQFVPFKEVKRFEKNIEGGLIKLKEGFIQNKRNQIIFLDKFSATALWQFDLGSFGEVVNDWGEKYPYEVEQFIGVLGSSLLVLLNQKEILALDIHTGKINQRLQYVDSLEGNSVLALDEKNKLKYYNTNYFVQEQNNIVYALFEDVLFEINAAQPTISTTAYGLKNEFDKYQINPYKVSSKTFYYDQKIYFLEQELGRFGILDLATRSILYVSEPIAISGEGLGFDKLKEIQVAENKIYVLDKTNTLHIFEKE